MVQGKVFERVNTVHLPLLDKETVMERYFNEGTVVERLFYNGTVIKR